MNKARRHELKMLKYKKRVKLYGLNRKLSPDVKTNYYAFRNHSCPCSCSFCSQGKYNRAKERRDIREALREVEMIRAGHIKAMTFQQFLENI